MRVRVGCSSVRWWFSPFKAKENTHFNKSVKDGISKLLLVIKR